MLYSNDVFLINETQYRLLKADVFQDSAWIINIDSIQAWPVELPYSDLKDIESIPQTEVVSHSYSKARLERCERSWIRLQPLIENDQICLYSPSSRKKAITEHALKVNCSSTTLYKDLRKFWQRGQTKFALLPDYNKSGRPSKTANAPQTPVTAGRGRTPKNNYSIFQLTKEDVQNCKAIIKKHYLSDSRFTVQDAYEELIRQKYRFADGNGELYANPLGSRPTLRQFRRVLHSHFDIERRLRSRLGNSDFEREHRKKLGTILQDCRGVGHYYEIDATIADIYLVSSEDSTRIIGKPTLYLIIDRKSRLIVGFYFGLENASWNGAMQAILSISEDKRDLCQKYGVEYHPEDWPAHQVFPSEFLADRGDMISNASSNIAEGLHITVTNLPSKRPDWKPLVECGFRQIQSEMRPLAPAYDPPSNATKRRGKHYEKDACLTLKDFGNLLVNTIIAHNRREITHYPLSVQELLEKVQPSPIKIWNHNIVSQAGLLTRYAEETVRLALLRKSQATVSAKGIEFGGCYYSCPEAINGKWFEMARKRHFNITVSYDTRLVDSIYIHPIDGKGEPFVACLTERSDGYKGLSFDEVAYYESLRSVITYQSEHQRLDNRIALKEATNPIIADAKQKLKNAYKGTSKKPSRTARRTDIKALREQERSLERQQLVKISESSALSQPTEPLMPTPITNSIAERIARAKERMQTEIK